MTTHLKEAGLRRASYRLNSGYVSYLGGLEHQYRYRGNVNILKAWPVSEEEYTQGKKEFDLHKLITGDTHGPLHSQGVR